MTTALPERNGDDAVVTLDRREGPYGEAVLRQRGQHYEIIVNGCFLMDTVDGRSERLLIQAALDELERTGGGAERPSVLIGGLGVGFSLAYAAAEPRWGRIAVVERESAIIDWHRGGPLGAFSGGALGDERVAVLHTDLLEYLAAEDGERFDALCLDIDNGPDWTVTDSNDGLYGADGLAALWRRLRPGGVLAVWSAQPSSAFEEALRAAGFADVVTHEIPVSRGVPDVVHLARRVAD
ncbi:spermidine synthase [Streptomyces rubellomurinus]|uniref:Spermidine synthase n=1 Tax=Streptomyces rubellomurinus (strain ATCC 31215) TaxID=359131 RepID=A0A0F2TE50_STRR3|nr:spermidine synthase [Streptomyces rubellomurinus]KJS60012.1 spermidine synthase [Streptomyces rubellomurinus]